MRFPAERPMDPATALFPGRGDVGTGGGPLGVEGGAVDSPGMEGAGLAGGGCWYI